MDVKKTQCPFCQAQGIITINTVPISQSQVKCAKCGKTYIVRAVAAKGN